MNFPYLYTLRQTIAYVYTLPNAIAYLNTCIPYLNTCITYLNTLTRLSALGYISLYIEPTRLVSAAKNTQKPSATNQHRLVCHSRRQPIRIEHFVIRIVSQPESSTEKIHQLSQPIRIEYYVTWVVSQSESSTKKTHQLRQPIRIEYYVTRVVSQSESSITSPESSRFGWKSLLGSRLSARVGSL